MDDAAPGWDAIDQALRKLYGRQKERHWAPPLPAAFGGTDPLHGVSAFRSTFGGQAHWHFVTFGFSDLFAKETDNPDVSGFGFELTCRVVDARARAKPPTWVVSLLQNLARYVFQRGTWFAPGHTTTFNGPIALGAKTNLVAGLFAEDRELKTIKTPHGSVQFVQLVGITEDEYEAIKSWDSAKFTAAMRKKSPALITNVQRKSLLAEPGFRASVEARTRKDGSSQGLQFANELKVERAGRRFVLELGARELADVSRMFRQRVQFEREARIESRAGGSIVLGGGTTRARKVKGGWALHLSDADQAGFGAIPIARGEYALPSGKGTVRVVPSRIWNADRTEVVKEIG